MHGAKPRQFAGGCHCGAISLTFSTAIDPAALPVRACQCSFCRKHASRAVTDPDGQVTLTFTRPDKVNRYRFGLECADYILCAACGVYVAAVTRGPTPPRAIAILNALAAQTEFTAPPTPTVYDGETLAQRQARRAAGWTPARLQPA